MKTSKEISKVCSWCCKEPHKSYKPISDTDFICSICTLRLASFSQEDLKRGQQIAIEKGLKHKAEILNSFIEVEHEQSNRRRPTTYNRIRTAGSIRSFKKRAGNLRRKEHLPFLAVTRTKRLYLESHLMAWLRSRTIVLNIAENNEQYTNE